MAYLADTNVIARWAIPHDPLFTLARAAVVSLHKQGETIYVTPQNIAEFWTVATRPAPPLANGMGISVAQVVADVQTIEQFFPLLPETPAIYPLWRQLVEKHGIIARQVYDARLVAVMLAHGVTHLLTLNPDHFQRYEGITVVHPQDV
jgi:predicted nucleic acid-binding protein